MLPFRGITSSKKVSCYVSLATSVLLFNRCVCPCPLHISCITSTSSIQKHSFVSALQNRCSQKFSRFHRKTPGWSLFSIKFSLQNTSGGCFYPCYFSCFFFYFFLAIFPLLPYSTVTSFVWRNAIVFMSLLLYMINIIIAEWFIRITTNATIYCTAISMIVKRISSALM